MTALIRHVLVVAALFASAAAPAGAAWAATVFGHRVPIRTPAGTNGMQPELALVYDPDAGNGLVGMGWHLSGLSSITRVNNGYGINYDGRDAYAHSQLGILITGPISNASTGTPYTDGSYRPRADSFTKAVPSGTCGDGPCSWVVYNRSGVKYLYGTTTDSRLLRQGSSSVRSWFLAQVEDVHGNFYDVVYAQDAANGQAYPSVLTYTKNVKAPIPGQRTVVFSYEARADGEPNYAQGALQQATQRLKWIAVNSQGSLLRKYRLDYELGPDTGRSRLVSITEYGSSGSTLPSQVFAYQDAGAPSWKGLYLPAAADFANGTEPLDFDGDGRVDLIHGLYDYGRVDRQAWRNTGTGFASDDAYAPPTELRGRDIPGPNGFDMGARFADLNGDGKPDLLKGFLSYGGFEIKAWINNGGRCTTKSCAWTEAKQWAPPMRFTTRNSDAPHGYDQGVRIADVNGDGRPDLLWAQQAEASGSYYTNRNAWLNNGNGWTQASEWAPPVGISGVDRGTPGGWDQGVRFVDLNGDGRPDIVHGWYNYGGTSSGAWLNNGRGWTWAPAYAPPLQISGRDGSAPNGWDQGVRFIDLNGDGKVDVVWGFYNYGTTYSGAAINNGNGWTANNAYAPPLQISGRDAGAPGGWDQGVRFVELNGDGRPDIGWSINNYGNYYSGAGLNNGGGWTLDSRYRPSTVLAIRDGSAPAGKKRDVRALDYNGDGKTEFLLTLPTYRGVHVMVKASTAPDLLATISNGLGGVVTATYSPVPQIANAVAPASTATGIPNTAPRHVVTRLETTDGRGGRFSTRYGYSDARWFPGPVSSQRDLGFGSIDAVDERSGQWIRTSFRQDPPYENRPSRVESYAATGQIVRRVTFTYGACPDTGACSNGAGGAATMAGTQTVVETSQVTEEFELGTPAFSRSTSTRYDEFGNPESVTESATGLPPVTVTTYHQKDTSAWVLNRVAEVLTTSGGTTLTWLRNGWVGALLQTKSEWLNTAGTGGSWVVTTLGYDANGSLTSLRAPATADGLTRMSTIQYDPVFKAYPSATTNALGHTTQLAYHADGAVASVTDPNGQVTRTTYDEFGRRTGEQRPDGGSTQFSYLAYGDPNAQRRLEVVSMSATQTQVKEEYFDGAGFVHTVRRSGDEGRHVWVSHCKDSAGRPNATSTPYYGASAVGCGSTSVQWTTTVHDEAGRPSVVTGPDGKVTRYAYSPGAHSVTDPNGNVTTTRTDARKRVVTIVDAAGQTTSYGYDALGRSSSVTLPSGAVSTVTYDSLNRKISTVDPQLGTTTTVYDEVGNVLSVSAGGKRVGFTYDELNRVRTKQPQGEAVVTYAYDDASSANARGRLTRVTDASGVTLYAYTPRGLTANYTKIVGEDRFTMSFAYDLGGRTERVTYPDGSHADYAYTDGSGNLATVSLNGTVYATWSDYNPLGAPGRITFGNGVTTTQGYDAVNHLQSLVTTKGGALLQDLSYDWYSRPNTNGLTIGRITDNRPSKIAVDGSNTDETQTYTYDALYRLRQAVGVWGTKSFAYDALGNPTTLGGRIDRTLGFDGQRVISGTGLSGVTYDAAGNMRRKVLDGTTWDYTWTAENALASISQNGALVAQMTYDAEGQRATKVFTPAAGPSVTTTYINKWYEKRTYGDGSPERHTLHLYANGQVLASVTKAGRVLTAFQQANGWRATLAAATMYSANDARGATRKVVQLARALGAHPRFGGFIGVTLFVTFSAAVIAVSLASIRSSHARRGHSARLRFASVPVVVAFTLACGGADSDRSGGLLNAESYLVSGDTLNGPALGTYFYHRNHLDSASLITDANGNEITRLVYLPFGELSRSNSSGGDVVTSKFTGQEHDDEGGLYYYGARYYDPAIGRFISADPTVPDLSNAQAFNRYSYALNNPVLYTDPTGLFSWKTFLTGLALVVIGALVAYYGNPEIGLILIANGVANIAMSFKQKSNEWSFWFSGPTDSDASGDSSPRSSPGGSEGNSGGGNGGAGSNSPATGSQQIAPETVVTAPPWEPAAYLYRSAATGGPPWSMPAPSNTSTVLDLSPAREPPKAPDAPPSRPKDPRRDWIEFSISQRSVYWMMSGDVVLATYPARSGSSHLRPLPVGYYEGSLLRTRTHQGMVCGQGTRNEVGFSLNLDPLFSTHRTELRIHPDGGPPGTAGCIGIQCPAAGAFYDALFDYFVIRGQRTIPVEVRP